MFFKNSRPSENRIVSKSPSLILLAAVLAGFATDTLADWGHVGPGNRMHIQYTGKLDTSIDAQVFNIDLFETSATTIAALHTKGRKVICYFSAGGSEVWRPDYNRFPKSVIGREIDGWAGENWLDIRQLGVLLPIMTDRINLAVKKGCDAVDPDLVDGYSNDSGFPLTYDDQIRYNQAIAQAAHAAGLAVGLKNDLEQIPDLLPHFDFAVNEQCFQYRECDALKPFIAAGKPVFGIEYSVSTAKFCPKANALNFDSQRKRLDLNAWREPCR